MNGKIVLAFSGKGANDAIVGLIAQYSEALADKGLSVVQIAPEPAEYEYAAREMSAGNVAFGLTWLGIGQDFNVLVGDQRARANAWEVFNVPLLKLHGDIPAYFQDLHGDTPRNAVNLYPAREFIDFRRRFMPEARALTGLVPPFVLAPIERSAIRRTERLSGTLVFLKNGNSPAELRRLWAERLSPRVARLVERIADAIAPVGLRPGPLLIGEFAADFLEEERIDAESARPLISFLTAQMDDYLRRLKSEMIARALLEFPVIVQGNLWEHVDFRGAKARLVAGQSFDDSHKVFAGQLGIIDMSPNIDTGCHERVQRAAGAYAMVLTNRQSWLESSLPGFDDLMFEFDPESIKARVAGVLANPDRHLDLAVSFGEHFRQVFPREAFADRIVDLAELGALQGNEEGPRIQPFFVWPGR